MHLSDEQLRDLDSQSNEPSLKDAQQHLLQCEACQNRIENIKAFRKTLAVETETAITVLNWQAIAHEIGAKGNIQKQDNSSQVSVLGKKVKRLQMALVAFAASVLILLAYPQFKSDTHNQLELQLAAIIKENHLLQSNFSQFKHANNVQSVAYRTTERKLQGIDQQIQRMYLDKLSTEQKIKLWDERKQLLIQSLNSKPKQTLFAI
jgi:hypothetical protein